MRIRTHYRHRLRLAALIAVGCAVAPAVAAAGPVYPIADPDPFYAAPADIGNHQPGDVLAVRAMPALPQFPNTDVTLVEFRSTGSEGDPIAATTTVLSPRNRAADAPMLSLQQIINGLGAQCAVSRVLYTSDPNLMMREAPAWNVVLQRGWSIALPDHLGPHFAYGAAKLGGQITLDGIRAAQRVPELKVQHSPVAMAGYSGGGMATAWAAALAQSYAPELHIAGAAMGGVPMNLVTMLEAMGLNRHPVFGLAMAAGLGLEREYPDRFPLSAQLNDRGLAIRDKLANSCTNDILTAGAGVGAMDVAKTTIMTEDPTARGVVEENSLQLYSGVPNMPVFEWHSPIDGLIPIDAVVDTIHRYCASGVKVWSEQVPVPDHLTAAVLGLPAAVSWLEARLTDKPVVSNCA
ncbi:lipase family protein [Nocardia sp. NPDC058058]|uniref:lipase family protein n=1 Tax=Nocardia sp. NPDC058058 TaxID=3346317 RepID=UPI0036DF54F0